MAGSPQTQNGTGKMGLFAKLSLGLVGVCLRQAELTFVTPSVIF
jgi:hypothetical protein